MKFGGRVRISSRTLALVAAAAREHELPVWRQASLALEAAALVWMKDAHSTAMPAADAGGDTPADIEVYLAATALALFTSAARRHGLDIEAQMRAALDAAVGNYEPPPARNAFGGAAPALGGGGVPHRPPFDPKRYVKGPGGGRGGPARGAAAALDVTAALMGDPAFGASVTATRAGGQTGDG